MAAKKKQKQISLDEYILAYCQEKRIRNRYAVYVSPETHRSLKIVAQLFKSDYHATTSSMADAILSKHFDAHRELLNEALRNYIRKDLEWYRNRHSDTPEEEDNFDDDPEACQDDDPE